MSKTYLWLHNIEKDFYKLVQLLRETFTTTPAQHVTTSDLQVLWGLKHGMDGWLLVTHTIFLSCKINWYFLLIYILRLYCFFFNLSTHFPNTTKEFFRLLENISNNPLPASHPKDRVVNVCKHKFACTNVTPKRRNGAHFITHAPHCAWVIMFCRNKFRIRGQERLLASPKGGYHLTQTWN